MPLKLLPSERIEHRLEGEELVCPQCGDTMTEIGTKVVNKLKIIPAQIVVEQHVYYSYACKSCSETADEGCEMPVIKAPHEKSVIPGSLATPEQLHKELVKREILHCDETTLQVLHEPGKAPESKSDMWLYRTSGDTEKSIVMYEYQPDRSAKYPIVGCQYPLLHRAGSQHQLKQHIWFLYHSIIFKTRKILATQK